MPNSRDLLRVRRRPRRSASRPRSSPSAAISQSPGGAGVRQRLERRERLRGDDEQRLAPGRGRAWPRRCRCRRRSTRTGTSASRSAEVAERLGTPSPGPRSDPPIPMLTTVRIALAGRARPVAAADALGERAHAVEDLVHVRHDVVAVDHDRPRPRGARSAMCSTGRSSVMLMRSPRNIASMRAREAGALGERRASRPIVSSVMRCLE